MLHILLMILKILGIALLVILAVLLLVILIVLFVPIRYRISGSKYEAIHFEANVSWLLKLIRAKVLFAMEEPKERKLHIQAKVAFLTIFDNLKPKKEKVNKDAQGKNQVTPVIDQTVSQEAAVAGDIHDDSFDENYNSDLETPVTEDTIAADAVVPDDAQPIEAKPKKKFKLPFKKKKPATGIKEAKPKKPKKSIDQMLCELEDKIEAAILKLKGKIDGLKAKADKINTKKERIMAILKHPKNQAWFKKTLSRLKKLIIRILPRISRLKLHYGMDDPATTGKILGYLCILSCRYEGKMEVKPEFEQKIMEGELDITGKIRLVHFVVFAIVTVVNKNFFRVIKQIKRI